MNGPTVAVARLPAWSAVRAIDRRVVLAALGIAAVCWTLIAEGLSLDAYRRIDPSTALGQAVHDALPTVVTLAAGVAAMAVRPASRTGAWLYLAGVLWFVGNLGNAARVISELHRGEKRLVFCDSRARVEALGAGLRELGVETYAGRVLPGSPG